MLIRLVLAFFLFTTIQAQTLHEGLYADQSKVNASSTWGFKNKKQKWVIKPQFDTVYHYFQFGRAIVGIHNNYGVIDLKGKTIIPFSYKEILPQIKHLFPVKDQQGKWGFMDTEGKEKFPALYDNFRLTYKDKHMLLQKDLRWGLYTLSNKELIAPRYKQIIYQNHKTYRVLSFADWQILRRDGSMIGSASADTLKNLTQDYYVYTLQGRKGIRNTRQETCTAQFENIKPAHDTLFFAQKNGYWGLVQSNGTSLLPFAFEAVEAYEHYFVALHKYREKKIYTWDLKPVTEESFLDVAKQSEGLWPVQNDIDLWGFLNAKGQLQIACQYSQAEPFANGLAKVSKEGNTYYINAHGETILSPSECIYYETGFLKVNESFQKQWIKGMHEYKDISILSDLFYRVKSQSGYGIIDQKGITILSPQYQSIVLSSDEQVFIAQKKNTYYIFNTSGQLIDKPHKRFERVTDASEGLLKIKYKGGWGFCDYEDRILISTQYEDVGLFYKGICAIKIRGKWGYVDRDERFVQQPYYDAPAVFHGDAGILKEKNDYHLINSKGKLTIEYPLQHITYTKTGFYIIQNKSGLYGLAGKDGKELIPAKYKSIKAYDDGTYIVTDEYFSGAIDSTGRIIVSVKYNTLFYDPSLKLFTGSIEKEWEFIKVN